ncbi:MAG: TraR/DksA C4-type zinc finger protein [Bacteriovoracaceae bacterium]|nr:TraR/DksA C4-type zinc finger protein [Bacteriovoracaceae bacterium]
MEAINAKSVSEANLNNAKLRLLKLKAALDRISDGDYGECLVCENEIAKNRLESVPEATRCIFCAEKNLKNGH